MEELTHLDHLLNQMTQTQRRVKTVFLPLLPMTILVEWCSPLQTNKQTNRWVKYKRPQIEPDLTPLHHTTRQLGSLSNDYSYGNENVASKYNFAVSQVFCDSSISFKLYNADEVSSATTRLVRTALKK